MLCLGLFVSDDCEAHEEINELIDGMEVDECLSLFGFPESFSHLEDDNTEEWAEIIIEYRQGWLVLAYVARPWGIVFDESTGEPKHWCHGGISQQILIYAETLEEALEKIAARADEILEKVFDEAREEQGLPECSSKE